MRNFLQGFRRVSNSESADLGTESTGAGHVPVVKRLSWAVTILEAQIGCDIRLATEDCSRELIRRAVLD